MEEMARTAADGADGTAEEGWTATSVLTGAPDRIRRQSPLLLLGTGTAPFAHSLLSHVLLRGERALVLDGANGFDAARLARVAQQRQHTIPTLLAAVRVSRAFTWPQWLELLEKDAEAEARRRGATWIFVLGILDLFADLDVTPSQARLGAGRAGSALGHLAQAGLGVVAAQDRRIMERAGRVDLLEPLIRRCGRLLEIAPAGGEPPEPDAEAFASAPAPANTQTAFSFGPR